MKAFEDWWENITIPHGATQLEKQDAKQAWRAALEWVQREVGKVKGDIVRCGFSVRKDSSLDDVDILINRELETQ